MNIELSGNVEKFQNELFNTVRVILDSDNNPWFFAKDVAVALGYKLEEARMTIARHVDAEDILALKKTMCSEEICAEFWVSPLDFNHKVFINESGLYCLIFESRLEGAKAFKRWVTTEVLPSIRKHGGYISGQELLDDEEKADLLAEISRLSNKVKRLTSRRTQLIAEKKREHERSMARKAKIMRTKAEMEDICNLYESMYEKLMEDYEALVREAKKPMFAQPNNSLKTEYMGLEPGEYIDINGLICRI